MKRFLLIILTLLSTFFCVSCKDAINLEMYLSEIRSVAYTHKGEDYLLTVYGEEKETPYLSDGYVGKMEMLLTVKIENYKTSLDDASVTITYGEKEVSGNFDYSPLKGKFVAEIKVNKLPSENEIRVTVSNKGSEESFTLQKFSKEGVIDYKTALNSVAYEKNDHIKKMLSGNGDSIEVRVRILTEGESVYYYVGVVGKEGKTLAYLVDGASGKILAERQT